MPSSASQVERRPAVLVPGRPTGTAPASEWSTRKPARSRARRSSVAARRVARPLLARRARRRRAPPPSPPAPGPAPSARRACAPRAARATSAGSPATKRGAVAGQVGPLGQRVHREQAVVARRRRPRVRAPTAAVRLPLPRRARGSTRRRPPPRRARGPRRRPCAGGRPAARRPVGLAGEFSQTQADPLAARATVRRVRGDAGGAGQPGADLVRRVGHLGVHDDVARPEAEQRRQPGHQLLGADRRQHRGRVDAGDPAARRTSPPRPPAGPACRW